jgi:monoterpene epsilon-lactone hydrolase
MPSLVARIVKLTSRALVKRNPKTTEELVVHIRRAFSKPPIPPMLPRGVRVEPARGIRGEWLRVRRAKRAILYLHGGGYIAGVTKTYHNLCSRLGVALDADVLLPDYRLAPEHPFPAGLEDALDAYAHLRASGFLPEQIVVAGDSAGGGLTLAVLLALRDRGEPAPHAGIVLSPFADLTGTSKSMDACDATDAMLSARMLRLGEHLYVPKGGDLTHPHASPAFAEYSGLPPLFITVCEQECLRDDAYAVAERARRAGVPVTFVSREDLLHVWPIFVPLMPEARDDLRKMVAFVKSTPARPTHAAGGAARIDA